METSTKPDPVNHSPPNSRKPKKILAFTLRQEEPFEDSGDIEYTNLRDVSFGTGLSYYHLSRIMSGLLTPKQSTLKRIASYLSWTISEVEELIRKRRDFRNLKTTERNHERWQRKIAKQRNRRLPRQLKPRKNSSNTPF